MGISADLRRAKQLCIGCAAGPLADGKAYCAKCAGAMNRATTARFNGRLAKGLCPYCGSKPKGDGKRCEVCVERSRQGRQRLKIETFQAYGGCVCACCQESELCFLSLDHVNNDGARHRQEVGTALYQHLRNNNWPNDPPLQVLCFNCNIGKKVNGGVCPHQVEGGLASLAAARDEHQAAWDRMKADRAERRTATLAKSEQVKAAKAARLLGQTPVVTAESEAKAAERERRKADRQRVKAAEQEERRVRQGWSQEQKLAWWHQLRADYAAEQEAKAAEKVARRQSRLHPQS